MLLMDYSSNKPPLNSYSRFALFRNLIILDMFLYETNGIIKVVLLTYIQGIQLYSKSVMTNRTYKLYDFIERV